MESFRQRRQLRAARRVADRELLRSPAPSLQFSWRAAELVIPKRRLDLAHQLRRLVHDADARLLPGAQTFDRLAVRAEAESFLALADRLADLERPVAPRGVLLVEQLLEDEWGPLYDRDRADELSDALDDAAEALEH
ncbi:MAG: hypothetical protein ACRDO9_08380 [Gaiellales bacterium]